MKYTVKLLRVSLPVMLALALVGGAWANAPALAGGGAGGVGLSGAIQPRDGLWVSKLIDNKMTGCPSMLVSRVKAMMPGMMDKNNAERRTFEHPFHPRDLYKDSEHVRWTQTAANQWHGVMKSGGDSQSGMSVNAVMDLHVVSSTHMEGVSIVTLKMPAQLAALMGGGSGTCTSRSVGSLDWSKG